MRAAVLAEHGRPLDLQTVSDPEPESDGVVVRVTATGICRSDYHIWAGDWSWLGFRFDLPLIPGHEVAGVVEAVGPAVTTVTVGQRVIVPFHIVCGVCRNCKAGRSNLCLQVRYLGGALPGTFAEYVAVPRADFNLVVLPDDISDEVGAMLGCRYMTAFHAVRDAAATRIGEWVAVFGAGGGVGLSAVQIAAALGAQVIAVDVGPAKLGQAQRCGAQVGVDAQAGSVAEQIREITGGGADVAIDTVATAATTVAGIESLTLGGRHVQVGMTGAADRGRIAVPVDLIVAKELSVLGVTGNPHSHYDELLHLVRTGRCDPGQLLTGTAGLADISGVFEAMAGFASAGFTIVDPTR